MARTARRHVLDQRRLYGADADGSRFTVVVSCRVVDEKRGVSDCFGKFMGVAGAYQDKIGTVS